MAENNTTTSHDARDRDLVTLVTGCSQHISTRLAWLRMRMKAEAPQALLVAS
ncbi:hypothetical protein [Mycobacterium noviomagense]|uniref:hypothetical protein n=1 Tax=Mycobacterium noviomagense TaxID=459858 RepID=UPI0013D5A74E|nr:hypothetical protein [Mycobacterium noviomagense]